MSKKQYIESIIKITKEEDMATKLGASTNKEIGQALGAAMYDIRKALRIVGNVDKLGILLMEQVLSTSIILVAKDAPTQELRKLFINNIINSLQKELIND